MRTIWQSLIWKEWHEHKWKLASILAVLVGSASLPLLFFKRDIYGGAAAVMMVGLVPLSIFVGLAAASNERARGTLAFMQALPAPRWKFAVAKLSFGLLTLILAVLLTVGLFYLWHLAAVATGLDRLLEFSATAELGIANRDSFLGQWHLSTIALCGFLATTFFVWSAATGVNRRDEVSAGAVALSVMLGWGMIVTGIGALMIRNGVPERVLDALLPPLIATLPAGAAAALGMAEVHNVGRVFVIAVAAAVHLGLLGWYVGRYGNVGLPAKRAQRASVEPAKRTDWLSPPRSSPITAIVWKQWRESVPLALAGLAGAVGIVLIILAGDRRLWSQGDQFAELVASVMATLGFVVALVVGIGISYSDLGALNGFWRSRPINPDTWFWTKFASGIGVLLITLYLPLVVIVYMTRRDAAGYLFSSAGVAMLLLEFAVFAAAAAMTCLARNAVYASVLGIGFVMASVASVVGVRYLAGRLGWLVLRGSLETEQMTAIAGLVLSIVTSTLVAW